MREKPGNIRYFGPRGFLEEMVERQGKGDQNVCNEPNYSEKIVLGPYHCLLRRKSFFKTQNFENSSEMLSMIFRPIIGEDLFGVSDYWTTPSGKMFEYDSESGKLKQYLIED